MFEIDTLEVSNFMCFKKFDISFRDRGLLLISGPNGSGKSAIYEAVVWCLFNKTIRQMRVDDVVNDYIKKDCQVTLRGKLNGKDLIVSRFRKHSKAGNDLLVVYDGKYLKGSVNEVQVQLTNLLGVDFDQFVLISSFIPDKIKFFAQATPSQRLVILSSILQLDFFDKAYEVAKERVKELDYGIRTSQKELEICSGVVEGLKNDIATLVREAEKRKKAIERDRRALKLDKRNALYKIKQLKAKLKELESKDVDSELNELKKREESIRMELLDVKSEISRLKRRGSELISLKDINTLIGKSCPVCFRPITQDVVAHVLSEIEEQCEDLTQELDKVERREKELLEALRKVEEDIALKEKWRSEVKLERARVSTEISLAEDLINEIDKRLKDLESDFAYEEIIKEKRDRLEEMMQRIEDLKLDIEQKKETHFLMEKVKELFSKRGVRFRFIERVLSTLKNESNSFLKILSSSRLAIDILSSDDNIDIVVYRDGVKKRYEDCSSGEKHRIECALALGLNRLMRKFHLVRTNFLFLDELFDRAIDSEGQEGVFEVLKILENEVPSIFVVSHRVDLQSQFENVLIMERNYRG